MSLYGSTKGTEMEAVVEQYLKAEAQGAVLYCALARLAKEQGLADVAAKLLEMAKDEARHAGLYAFLNGHTPQDLHGIISLFGPMEAAGRDQIAAIAQQARDLGLEQAAVAIDAAAEDEKKHGIVLASLLKPLKEAAEKKIAETFSF